jgi:YcaO-like protein with predicted kinase domain
VTTPGETRAGDSWTRPTDSQRIWRAGSPAETFKRIAPLMPLFGITRIADVTGLDRIGVSVAMAYRPNARSISVSPGKGSDIVAAKTSALMEAIEGWHAERIMAPLVLASLNELRFERRVIDVAALPRREGGELHDDLRMLWIEGNDLVDGGSVWIPFEVVHTNYTYPMPAASGALLASSNGLASGNNHLQALNHALCEIIERDAVTLWFALDGEARRDTLVDLGSIDHPACRSLLARFEQADVAVAVWDITSDVGLPAFRCAILDAKPSRLRPHFPGIGAGCHPDRDIALLRALTEAAQTRLTLICGARDDLGVAQYADAVDRGAYDRLLAAMGGPGPRRSHRQVPTFLDNAAAAAADDTTTLEQRHLTWTLTRLRAIGINEVTAIDLTKPRLGIPVVRAVVPGLEGISDAPGYCGGARYRNKLKERRQ